MVEIGDVSAVEYESALFLAALPYRRSVYRSGGWQVADVEDLESFARQFYRAQEITQAHHVAEDMAKKSNGRRFWLANVEYDIHYAAIWDEAYPHFLKNIYDPPPILFIGVPVYAQQHDFFQAKSVLQAWKKAFVVSIVGTRRANPLCRFIIDYTLERLSKQYRRKQNRSLHVVSGFASGVDSFAHQIALEKKLITWAVLGSGLYHCGPLANYHILRAAKKNQQLLFLVSEFLHNQIGRSYSFPRRNRLIAGLAHLVCIIQAPKKSGALITAQYAIEEGRDVWVFDHPIFQSLRVANEGCQNLLAQGARPLEIPESIIQNIHKMPLALPDKAIEDVASRAVQQQLFRRRMSGAVPLSNGYFLFEEEG